MSHEMRRRLEISDACSITAVLAIVIFLTSDLVAQMLSAAGLLCWVGWRMQAMSPLYSTLVIWLTFFLPLLIIHSFLNPAYKPEEQMNLSYAFSETGFSYAMTVGTNFFSFAVIAASWINQKGDHVLAWVASYRLPVPILVFVFSSFGLVSAVERKVKDTHEAQIARGIIQERYGVFQLTNIPKLLVPTVINTLIDANDRAEILAYRGLGEKPLYFEYKILDTRSKRFGLSTPLIITAAALLIAHVFNL